MAGRLRRAEDGATAVVIALLVVFVVVPVAAVSVDLSSAYSNRRQMVNAADAAAQAGAQVMATGQATTTIDAAAKSVATANGVDTADPDYSCEVVTVAYSGGTVSVTQSAPCTSWTATGGYNAVRVKTVHTIQTFFASALGLVDGSSGTSTTKAASTAIAAVQRVVPPASMGTAVFAMCAFDDGGNGNGNNSTPDPTWAPLLVSNGAGGYQLNLNTDPLVSPLPAIGHRYVVWSNAGGNSNLSRCGLGSSAFDGRICGLASPHCGQPLTLPNWLAIDTGAAVGPTLATMAGYAACDPSKLIASTGTKVSFAPCAMALPVCHMSNNDTGTNGQLYCDAFGEFLMSPGTQDSNDSSCTFMTGLSATICGEFLGAPDPADGTVTSGPPGPNDAYRVALVQ